MTKTIENPYSMMIAVIPLLLYYSVRLTHFKKRNRKLQVPLIHTISRFTWERKKLCNRFEAGENKWRVEDLKFAIYFVDWIQLRKYDSMQWSNVSCCFLHTFSPFLLLFRSKTYSFLSLCTCTDCMDMNKSQMQEDTPRENEEIKKKWHIRWKPTEKKQQN